MAASTCLWISCVSLIITIILTLIPVGYGNTEVDALQALKRSLSDPNNVLTSWDPNLVDPCTWFHITCDQDNFVTRVDLAMSNLSGNLVPDLANLERLQYLTLFGNNIGGTIPEEFGNFKSLLSLDLYNNNLSGAIPSSLEKLRSILFIRLNNNRLTGPISFGFIPTLRVLDLSSNNLCGAVPPPIRRIPTVNLQNNPRLGDPSKPCP